MTPRRGPARPDTNRPVDEPSPAPVGPTRHPAASMSRPPAPRSPFPGRVARLALALTVGLTATVDGVAVAQDAPQEGREHPLAKAIRYAKVSLDAAESLPGYTASLRRREIVDGKPVDGTCAVKFRAEPFSVYMRFTDPEHAGRQVLYVEGQNGGKMLAREAGGLSSLAGTVKLAPDSPLVTANSRHPITSAGLANMARGVIARWTEESRYGECDVKYFAEAELEGRPVVVIESSHPVPRKEFRYARTRLWMDKETKLPVRLQQYEFRRGGGEPVLAEDYTYTDVRTDVRLSDADFHPRAYKL